jgi:hypothetical protein
MVHPSPPCYAVSVTLFEELRSPAWASRSPLPLGTERVVVISREALIAMKALAARPQDLADIQNLKDGDR